MRISEALLYFSGLTRCIIWVKYSNKQTELPNLNNSSIACVIETTKSIIPVSPIVELFPVSPNLF